MKSTSRQLKELIDSENENEVTICRDIVEGLDLEYTQLEHQVKKQKEAINKAIEYIKKRFYFNEETGEYSLLHTFNKDNIKELLDILNEALE